MEKKNTILLTVIAVATLLVAVVGATFAYFTATNKVTGSGKEATVTTNTVGAVSLETTPGVEIENVAEYPGGYIVASANVTATDADANNNFNVTYTLNATVNNGTATPLNWTMYKLDAALVGDAVSGCKLATTQSGNTVQYSYGETCKLNASFTEANKVGEGGTIAANKSAGTIEITSETLSTANTGETAYYYLVIKYPDTGADQTTGDAGKTITATITGATAAQAELAQ